MVKFIRLFSFVVGNKKFLEIEKISFTNLNYISKFFNKMTYCGIAFGICKTVSTMNAMVVLFQTTLDGS